MDFLSVAEKPSYLHVQFHDASSSNAMSLGAARELSRLAKKDYRSWRKPVVLSSGHSRMFCSGGHLTDYAKLKTPAAGLKVNREITQCLDVFGAWPVVKLAVIEGDVLGGGMEWLARFDFRWCAPHVLFSFWQRRIGLSFGWGGGRWWSDRLGEPVVRQLLLEGRLLSSRTARSAGLVDRVVSRERMWESVDEWTKTINAENLNPALSRWSVKSESAIFSKLWMKGDHAQFLKGWRK